VTDASTFDPTACVAVIGVGLRVPGASDPRAFWQLLMAGREGLQRFDRARLLEAGLTAAELDDPAFVPARSALLDAGDFDAAFFGMSPAEAAFTDPQHRLFLECCQLALDDGAVDPERAPGPIGVYGGCSENRYFAHLLRADPQRIEAAGPLATTVAHDKDHLVTRAAYKLGLTGPAVLVQSSCSTGLVAIHQAAQALLSFQCDLALAGGASVAAPLVGGHRHRPGDIYSPDGHTRPFDAAAAGTVSGDGAAVVLLRRLDEALRDGDPVRAVLRGSALNNDGSRKLGYSAPSVAGQAACIRSALAVADLAPAAVGLVEAHGTATPMGDPMEVAALVAAYGDGLPAASIGLGSVKSNLGHTNAAAGALGFVKAALAVEAGQAPPSLHFARWNPEIVPGPFFMVSAPQPWPKAGAPVAAVSSFGAGGTNAHALLSAPPSRPARPDGPAVLRISAASSAALLAQAAALAEALQADASLPLPAVAETLGRGRRRHPHRLALHAAGRADAALALGDPRRWRRGEGGPRRLIFFCPAHGAQQIGMGAAQRQQDPVFAATLERCFLGFQRELGVDLAATLYPPAEEEAAAAARLAEQRFAGPALFSLALAQAASLAHRGVVPDGVVGHSAGDYAAAVIAGALSLEEGLWLFAARARLLDTTPPGAGLFVPVDATTAARLVVPGTFVALENGPAATVLTGARAAIEALAQSLRQQGLTAQPVGVSFAAHSPLVAPIAPAFHAQAATLGPRAPRLPLYSGVSGGALRGASLDADYWERQLCAPARFSAALAAAEAEGPVAFLSLGPPGSERVLLLSEGPGRAVLAGPEHPDEALAALWAAGVPCVEGLLAPVVPSSRLHLPGTVFVRQRCWIDAVAPAPPRGAPARRSLGAPRPALPEPPVPPRGEAEAAVLDLCEELLGMTGLGMEDDFPALGGDSLFTLRLVERLQRDRGVTLPPGAAWTAFSPARMAALLPSVAPRPAVASALPACLVPLRRSGSRPPLYLAHPLAGVVFPYIPISRALGDDQPVYGLQAAGIDGQEAADPTVEAMAARYVAGIRAVQPRGPYFLAGYSFGSYLAYEMALQLEAAGERVPLVALMDEVAPVEGNRPGLRTLASLAVGPEGRSFLQHLRDYLALGDREALRPSLRQWRGLLERAALATLLPDDAQNLVMGRPAMRPLLELAKIHWRETLRYAPSPRKGGVVLFKSEHWSRQPRIEKARWTHTLGWDALALGGVEVVPVSGDHLGMIRDPHAIRLAAGLRAAMNQVLKGPPPAAP